MSPLPEMVRFHELSAALVIFLWLMFGVYPRVYVFQVHQNRRRTMYRLPMCIYRAVHLGNDKGEKEFRRTG